MSAVVMIMRLMAVPTYRAWKHVDEAFSLQCMFMKKVDILKGVSFLRSLENPLPVGRGSSERNFLYLQPSSPPLDILWGTETPGNAPVNFFNQWETYRLRAHI